MTNEQIVEGLKLLLGQNFDPEHTAKVFVAQIRANMLEELRYYSYNDGKYDWEIDPRVLDAFMKDHIKL